MKGFGGGWRTSAQAENPFEEGDDAFDAGPRAAPG